MAAQAPRLTRARRWVVWPSAALIALVITFFLSAWIGSSIPRNTRWVEPEQGVAIMVETNGVHTAIVMPLVTAQKDWRADFPTADLAAPDAPYTHVSVSWGEKEVFLNTPTWGDLKLSTAVRAAWDGEALLHVSHYVRPAPSPDHRVLIVRPEEYARLVRAIERQLMPTGDRASYPGYAAYDSFYDAPGAYNLGNTCNQWTSDVLAEAGIKTGWWTPLAGGVMKWVPKPR